MSERRDFEWRKGKPTEPGSYHLGWANGHESCGRVYLRTTPGDLNLDATQSLWTWAGPLSDAMIVAWAPVATPEEVGALVGRAEAAEAKNSDYMASGAYAGFVAERQAREKAEAEVKRLLGGIRAVIARHDAAHPFIVPLGYEAALNYLRALDAEATP